MLSTPSRVFAFFLSAFGLSFLPSCPFLHGRFSFASSYLNRLASFLFFILLFSLSSFSFPLCHCSLLFVCLLGFSFSSFAFLSFAFSRSLFLFLFFPSFRCSLLFLSECLASFGSFFFRSCVFICLRVLSRFLSLFLPKEFFALSLFYFLRFSPCGFALSSSLISFFSSSLFFILLFAFLFILSVSLPSLLDFLFLACPGFVLSFSLSLAQDEDCSRKVKESHECLGKD